MPYFIKDNCKLYYECYGEGKESLILLHGNGEDGTYFKHQIAYFQKQFRVITMDMRGHGKSELGMKHLDFRLFAFDVFALMDELQLEKAHFLGFSDGGNTALQMALMDQNRMYSLILNGADLNPKGVKASVQIPIVIAYHILCLMHSKIALHKREVMNLMVHHPNFSVEQIKAIRVPTLVLVGNRDMIKEKHSQIIAKSIPNAHLIILKGTHFIAQKAFVKYNQCVENFLQNV